MRVKNKKMKPNQEMLGTGNWEGDADTRNGQEKHENGLKA